MSELLFSGVKPTNLLHLGNYIGALKQWTELQQRYHCLFCVVDLHAITVPQKPEELRKNSLSVAATYLAAGIDHKRASIFIQSEVSAHAELGWILGTLVKISELERMTQYKDKSRVKGENVGAGLLNYPSLMAADILLYDSVVVPVGEDQLQHLELTRTVARRFNSEFGETFVVPQPLVQKVGARIMGLDDPSIKMSKSASSANNYIALTDTPEVIRKKFAKAVTDSGTTIEFDAEQRPGLANLITIYHHATGKTMKEIVKEYEGKGYGDFKKGLAEAVIEMLKPFQEKYTDLMSHPDHLAKILDEGRDHALELAEKKLALVKQRVGLGR